MHPARLSVCLSCTR